MKTEQNLHGDRRNLMRVRWLLVSGVGEEKHHETSTSNRRGKPRSTTKSSCTGVIRVAESDLDKERHRVGIVGAGTFGLREQETEAEQFSAVLILAENLGLFFLELTFRDRALIKQFF